MFGNKIIVVLIERFEKKSNAYGMPKCRNVTMQDGMQDDMQDTIMCMYFNNEPNQALNEGKSVL